MGWSEALDRTGDLTFRRPLSALFTVAFRREQLEASGELGKCETVSRWTDR
jgi:hypothetical protein